MQNVINKWNFDNKLSRYSLSFEEEYMEKEFKKVYLQGKYAWHLRSIGFLNVVRYVYSAYMAKYHSLNSDAYFLFAFLSLLFPVLTFNKKVKRNIHNYAFGVSNLCILNFHN